MFKIHKLLFLVIILFIGLLVGACVFTPPAPTPVAEVIDHVRPEPLAMTVTNQGMKSLVTIAVTNTAGIDSDWDVPAGAVIENVEMKSNGDEVQPWYTFRTKFDRISRRIYSESIGTDPEPVIKDYALAPNEYVLAEFEIYMIELVDDQGQVWLWVNHPEYYQKVTYGETLLPFRTVKGHRDFYMKFDVGMKVTVTDYFVDEGVHDVLDMEPAE